jgi:hypothetical protein
MRAVGITCDDDRHFESLRGVPIDQSRTRRCQDASTGAMITRTNTIGDVQDDRGLTFTVSPQE